MTFPLEPAPSTPRITITTALFSLLVVCLVQFAGVVAWGARAEQRIHNVETVTEPLRNRGELVARVAQLEQTTEPIRRGELVKIQTDVAWIRETMERERAR